MISVVTPTNNPRYMTEAYESLLAQTYQDWEWIVVPNGDAVWGCNDPRVRVISSDLMPKEWSITSIGALKNFACKQAKGWILVELDHDDMLTPTCLEQILKAFEDDPEVGMTYSNWAEFNDSDWGPKTYSTYYGWEYREREFYGHKVQEARSFPPNPLAMSHINFAPNHCRAWRTSEYWRIGGHDPNLPVADDFDLCCRMYLQSKLAYIDDCLYLYRVHDGQTVWLQNADIQTAAYGVTERLREPIIKRWCELEHLPMIDLGGGLNKPEGYISIDLRDTGDIKADLRRGIPLADNSVGVVRAKDLLEHLPDKVQTMNEIYRVLVPGGWLLSLTPTTDGRGAFQDPTHCSYWNSNSFWYYTNRDYAVFNPEFKGRFQARYIKNFYPQPYHEQHLIMYVQADLVALKDGMGRIPGAVEI